MGMSVKLKPHHDLSAIQAKFASVETLEITGKATLPDWIDAHVRAFDYFGGAPRLLVPDNPKVAIIKACFYDPQVNRTYGEMAAHYDTALLPARPRKPRDKAKVESAVRIVQRWLLGKLRHRRFYSLAEVNAAIAELLVWLNEQRVLRYIRRTRRQLFEAIDAPLLKPLPAAPYAFADWRVRKVGMDYHVDVDGHFYSVPYRFARAKVELRATLRTIEIFFEGDRIAAHMRGSGDGKHTTIADHMPSSHRRHKDWTFIGPSEKRDRPITKLMGPECSRRGYSTPSNVFGGNTTDRFTDQSLLFSGQPK